MDQKKRVSSLKQYPVLAAFTLFFAALFVLDLVTPDRAYSELENTTLTQRPKLTAVSVDGLNNYFTNYTKYVKDQVFGRDQWISLQSLAETTLFQKTQSGGILLGREHRMFARRYRVLPTEERVWNKNLAAVQSLGERYPGKVSFMLVPSASVLYPEDLPLAAPQMDEEGRIDEAKAALPAVQFLRVTDALRAHNIDLVVLAGYMRILSPAFVSHYQGRLLNIHPSLLPKYPGLHTHRQVLENGDEEHGTSVHFVTDELDGGPVILQAKVPVFAGDSEEEITARVQAQEHAIYPLVISWFVDGRLRMAGNHAWLDERQLPPQGYAADE